jgi:hypothetical protein
LIAAPLSKFGSMFQLDVQKDIMPYECYTEANMLEEGLPLAAAEAVLAPAQYIEFLKRLTTHHMIHGGDHWDHKSYALLYCFMDCEVLMKGYMAFRAQVTAVCEDLGVVPIDVIDMISSSQLTFELAKRQGLLEGVHELSGTLRHVLAQCVRGGKVMTRDNAKWKISEPLTDLDANGLYASAMHTMGGFLLGVPKPFVEADSDYVMSIPHDDGTFFAEVQFSAIPKALHFPLLHVKHPQNGTHHYTNDAEAICATTHWMDATFLNDVIEYHGLARSDFRLIRGYYYDGGRNTKVRDFMDYLKVKRDEAKSTNNPMEALYKLLGNGLYGRMLMKPVKTQRVFRPQSKLVEFLRVHYHSVISYSHITPHLVVIEELKSMVDHWALPHIGAEILSVSKHIMNVPMMIAEANGIDNYYMDTDSMHIVLKEVPRLAELFEQETGYPLIGDEYGQFKCDFALSDSLGRPCNNVKAAGTWILGKKCYLDMLEGISRDGDPVKGFHARIKGCSRAALFAKGDELFPEMSRRDQMNCIYEAMANGDTMKFDLMAKGEGAKLGFVSNKNFTTSTRESFTRRYTFKGPYCTI